MNNNCNFKENIVTVENEQEKNLSSSQDKLNNPPVDAISGAGMTFNSNLEYINKVNGTRF